MFNRVLDVGPILKVESVLTRTFYYSLSPNWHSSTHQIWWMMVHDHRMGRDWFCVQQQVHNLSRLRCSYRSYSHVCVVLVPIDSSPVCFLCSKFCFLIQSCQHLCLLFGQQCSTRCCIINNIDLIQLKRYLNIIFSSTRWLCM
jgi:hypothetical protein